MAKYGPHARPSPPHTIQLKLPENTSLTTYKYIEQPLWIFPPTIYHMPATEVRQSCFQEKLTWLRMHV